jgi:hypothetical protein
MTTPEKATSDLGKFGVFVLDAGTPATRCMASGASPAPACNCSPHPSTPG